MITADTFKTLQKYLQSSDKTWEGCKHLLLGCLRVFVSATLNYSSLHTYFEQIIASTIKGFEDVTPEVTEENIRICFHLFSTRLQESQ
jgi:hypothetical protein